MALAEDERAAVTAAIAEADPLAEVLVGLTCPACDRAFSADVDVAEFAWRALRDAGRRLLGEVDALARAYGWTEHEGWERDLDVVEPSEPQFSEP